MSARSDNKLLPFFLGIVSIYFLEHAGVFKRPTQGSFYDFVNQIGNSIHGTAQGFAGQCRETLLVLELNQLRDENSSLRREVAMLKSRQR